MFQGEAINRHPHPFGANSETNVGIRPPVINNFVIAPMYGTAQDSEITLHDLINSNGLEAATIKNYVASLAQGLASLHAEPLVGVTQTLSGGEIFQQDDWFNVATSAKELGATLAFTNANGSPVAIFSGDGDAYVLAQDSSGTPNWVGLSFGKAQQFKSLGKADGQVVEERAQLVQGFAAAAFKPVTDFVGFQTTEIPYTSHPKLEMNTDGSMSFRPGEKLIGVKVPLPGSQFGLVIGQVVPGKNGYQF